MQATAEFLEERAVRKVTLRLLSFLVLLYCFSYLDRINIGFAALSMNKDLMLSATRFGAANTIFYLGYCLCEIPSNLMLARYGARLWIPRILITWGIASVATMFASSATSLYLIRAIVGIAEGGFLPGVLLYLTLWYPEAHRARANALFMLAQPLTIAAGAPLSGLILDTHGWAGLAPWRWVFLVEGLPSAVLGVIAYFYLANKPAEAKWLSDDEKEALTQRLTRERRVAAHHPSLWRELMSREVLLLAAAYFGLAMTLNTNATWTPQIVREAVAQHSFKSIGLLTALPALVTVLVMPLWSAHSDRRMERAWHTVAPMALAAAGWVLVALFRTADIRMLGLTFCSIGAFTAMGVFWTVPQTILSPAARPAGIAFIGSCGILASVTSPLLIGFLKDLTHSFTSGLLFLSVVLVAASALILTVVRITE